MKNLDELLRNIAGWQKDDPRFLSIVDNNRFVSTLTLFILLLLTLLPQSISGVHVGTGAERAQSIERQHDLGGSFQAKQGNAVNPNYEGVRANMTCAGDCDKCQPQELAQHVVPTVSRFCWYG